MYYLSYFDSPSGLERLFMFTDLDAAKLEMYQVMGKVHEPRLYYGNAQGTQGTAVVFCADPNEAWLLAASEAEKKMGTPLTVKRARG